MPIPTYTDWMNETNLGALSVRSFKLRDVDNALEAYWKNQNNPNVRGKLLSDIRIALLEWGKDKPGHDCRNSSRNKPPRRIVTQLLAAVNDQPVFTAAEVEAFRWQETKRRERVRTIFENKRIAWKMVDTPTEIRAAHIDLKRIKGTGSSAHKTDRDAVEKARHQFDNNDMWLRRTSPGKMSAAQNLLSAGGAAGTISRLATGEITQQTEAAFGNMLCGLFNSQALGPVNEALVKGVGISVGQLAADVVPLVSLFTSGAKMLIDWGKVGWAAWRHSSTAGHSSFLSEASDIEAAYAALDRLLERKTTAATLEAGIQSADFIARGALTIADGGAASSAALGVTTTLAKLAHKLYLFARELAEKREADAILADSSKLGFGMFDAYPLLGCYMLTCSDLSELIILSRDVALKNGVPFGAQGWKYDVEYLKRTHIDPVLKRAVYFIHCSPFHIPGMAMHVKYNVDAFDKIGWYAGKASAIRDVASIGRAVG